MVEGNVAFGVPDQYTEGTINCLRKGLPIVVQPDEDKNDLLALAKIVSMSMGAKGVGISGWGTKQPEIQVVI